MSAKSDIEWTDATWNPVRGCALVSPGCENCYAMKVAHRFSAPGRAYDGLTVVGKHGPRWTGTAIQVPTMLAEPLHWKKPRRIFVNSMSDLFHQDVPDEYIAAVFGVMAACPQHTFQVLTKRPERMRQWFAWIGEEPKQDAAGVNRAWFACHVAACNYSNDYCPAPGADDTWPLPNVQLGVSIEDRARADRMVELVQVPAAVHFLSLEPLLEDLGDLGLMGIMPKDFGFGYKPYYEMIDWVIVGGESGPGARPFDLAWARSIVRQCKEVDVPVFVKQLGSAPVLAPGDAQGLRAEETGRLRSKKGGDISEWPEDLRVRQFPRVP